MPARIFEASAQRDIIAYLQAESRKSSSQSEHKSVAEGLSDQHQKE